MNEQSITLDLRKTGFGKRVVIRQNDYHGITLAVDVTDGSKAYSVPAGAKCCLMARLLGSYVRDGGCTVEGGRIVYTADERMFGASGTAEAYFRIEVDGAVYSTEGFQLVVERAADSYAQLSEAYDTEVDRAIKGADDAAAKADDAAEGAKAAGGRADAAAKKAVEAAAKAEAGAGKVDEATASATTAAEKAGTAAQHATAAANKVFPAADNILAGSASGAVAHAEDAFEGAALRGIAVEGACRQDGIPSPDAPKPITVVENPAVKVVGRNLANPSEAYYFAAKGNPKAEQTADGFRFTVTNNDTRIIAVPCDLKKGDAIVVNFDAKQLSGAAQKIQSYFPTLNEYVQLGKPHVMGGDASLVAIYIDHGTVGEYEVANFRVSRNVDDGYKPYTSQTLTFALPAEHPYLAKLPDGTADEIVVDAEGNVELVARVSKATIVASNIVNTWGKGYAVYSWPNDGRYSPDASSDGTAVVCDKLKAETGENIYKGLGVGISVGSTTAHNKSCATVIAVGDGADLSSIDGASFYYPLMTPVRYKLAPIDMPKAQDSIVNAWTDAEVTPSTSIRYIRDINVVVANIESAIASIS